MKNIISTTIMIIFSSLMLIGQNNIDSLISKNNVKSIYEIRHKFEDGIQKSSDTVGHKHYNQDFRLIEEFSKFHSYKYQYEYSSNGLMTKKVKLDNQNNKEIERIWVYEYDNNDRIIKEVSYWTDSKRRKYIILYVYDEQNQLVAKNSLNHKKEIVESTSKKFYKSGELYETKYEEKYNKSAFKIERFDKCGNLIYLYQNGEEESLEIQYSFISLCSNLLKKESYLIDTLYVQNEVEPFVKYVIIKNNRKSVYSYNTTGNLLQVAKFQFKEDETLNRSEVKIYNNKGQLIHFKEFYHWSMCNYSPSVNETAIQEKYEYYQNGLLDKIYHFGKVKSDKPDFIMNNITEYRIEYYK